MPMIHNIKNLFKKMSIFLNNEKVNLRMKIDQKSKAQMLLRYARPEFEVFVETGTNRGDMIEALSGRFKEIYSIELDPEKYKKAVERFSGNKGVNLIHGDSGSKIDIVLKHINAPALFWLDAHGDTVFVTGPNAAPVKKELESILSHSIKGHVILIDDARHVNSEGVSILKEIARSHNQMFLIREGIFIIYAR